MISIITVSYNSAATIERTIRSVLNQTDTNCEHIFIDGASTDDTVDRIEHYRPLYKKAGIAMTVISEPDNGYYDAMNKGITLAKGDYIGILNSDDAYAKNTVATINLLKEYYRLVLMKGKPDIIMGAIRVHNGERVFIKHVKNRNLYQTSRNFNHPAMFATPACYARIGTYQTDNVHDDYRWYLKAIREGATVRTTRIILADFYTGGESAAKNPKDVKKRIQKKYEVYRTEGYSPLYFFECVGMEVMKYLLVSMGHMKNPGIPIESRTTLFSSRARLGGD